MIEEIFQWKTLDLKVVWGLIAILFGLSVIGYGFYLIDDLGSYAYAESVKTEYTLKYSAVIFFGIVICIIGSKMVSIKNIEVSK